MQEINIPKFQNKGVLGKEIREAVEKYFLLNNIKKNGDLRLFVKTTILLSLLLGVYYFLIFTQLPWYLLILLCLLLGAIKAGIGFNVMHDAIHDSYSNNGTVNYLLGLSLNILGANNTLWKTKHNIIHHTNTNIDGFDEDIEAGPLLRLHPNQKWLSIHKYQHKWWYWGIVYSLLYLVWIWFNDYKKYYTKKILHKKIKFSFTEHMIFWVSKIIYLMIFVIIPIEYVGLGSWVFGYLITTLTTGLLISLVFQMAHIVEEVQHPVKETTETECFKHQIATTADFATNNKFLKWYLGGLNFQIEHHLFPKISHIHYGELHKIIKPICINKGIKFTEYRTFRQAIKSHINELKSLGKKPILL